MVTSEVPSPVPAWMMPMVVPPSRIDEPLTEKPAPVSTIWSPADALPVICTVKLPPLKFAGASGSTTEPVENKAVAAAFSV